MDGYLSKVSLYLFKSNEKYIFSKKAWTTANYRVDQEEILVCSSLWHTGSILVCRQFKS
jgi:hypothetical protein